MRLFKHSLALVALSVVACNAPTFRPLNPCEIEGLVALVPLPLFADQVDLLFVIDNSADMAEEQRLLAAEMPRLVRSLSSGQSPNGAFVGADDIRVGVVTTDMGSGGFSVPTCTEPNFGDDGTLQRRAATLTIPPEEPPFLNLRRGDPSSPDDVAELVQIGTSGCGFRQPLEAALKAITPADDDTLFASDTRGHGDGTNQCFLRDDSMLAVVVLSNQDDCSASDPELFNDESDVYTEPVSNLRCWRYGEPGMRALHPIQRYVDGLLALRDPDKFIFTLIGGVPSDLAHAPGVTPDFASLVGADADPRMRAALDPAMPTRLSPSCEHEEQGSALPPSRLIRASAALAERGARVVVQSLCQDNYALVTDALLASFGEALRSSCIHRPLEDEIGAEGRLDCEIVEVLPAGGASCDELEGRVFREVESETDRELCTVCQVDADGLAFEGQPGCPNGAGWSFEANAARCPAQRAHAISFTENAVPSPGAFLRLECEPTVVTLGTNCEADPAICDESVVTGVTCHPSLHQCLFLCGSDAECRSTVGGGYSCYDPDDDGLGHCANPTCAP